MRGNRMGLVVLLAACGIGLVPSLFAQRDGRKSVAYQPGDPDAGLPIEVLDPAEESQLSVLAGGSCELVSRPPTLGPTSSSVIRGNAFRISRPSDLTEIQMELSFGNPQAPVQANASFSIHKNVGTSASPIWDHFWSQSPAMVLFGTGRKFYSSGPITPPTLAMGVEYYIGLTWGSVNIQYFRDSTGYPLPYSDGLVLGSAGAGVPTGPPVDPAIDFFFPPFPSAAYSMQLCITPKPGACCLGLTCNDTLTQTQCLAQGGSYSEDLLTCAQLQQSGLGCPLATGACCQGVSCSIQDGFQCERFGGEWQQGVACASLGDNPCLPQGACCSPSGTCSEESQENCQTANGVYQGDDTTCAGVGPACQLGACCKDGLCNYVVRTTCANNAGLWRGAGTDCDGDLCDPTGACCSGQDCAGGADAVTAEDCSFASGMYRGDWTSCASLPADCDRGACCTSSFGCINNVDTTVCTSVLSGSFRGIGTSCDTISPPCSGTCCFQNQCLANPATPTQCTGLPGVFIGYGSNAACGQSPCVGVVSGRCCMPSTGTCFVTSNEGCTELGGTFSGGGTCSPNICASPGMPGACCLPNGLCVELIASKCTTEGGVFSGAGTDCSLELCAVGACCPGNGGACINNATVATCNANSGSYFSGETCGAVTCPAIGACCLPSVPCQKITQANCTLMGGIYAGDNVNCAAGTFQCTRRSCCLTNGSCITTIFSQCGALGGNFDINSGACSSSNPCGACCTNGGCAVRTDFQCTTVHQGEGTNCLSPPPICELGTCCTRDGMCSEVTESECLNMQGLFGRGLTCAANPCPPTGKCCQTNSTCDIIREFACDNEGGIYLGDNTSCVSSECHRGSCCLPNGSCIDTIASECMAMNGEHSAGNPCAISTCPATEACCVNGNCQLLTPFGCFAIGGTSVGSGASCTAGLCTLGACCDRNGGCLNTIAMDCTTPSSVFTAGADCANAPCVVGACCKEGTATACEILRQSTCMSEGGTYAGNGSDCTQSHCARGACCFIGQQCARFPGCFGGANDGTPCTSNAQCTGGGTCSTSRCFGGMNDGTPCTSNAQCTGVGMCFTSACFGGSNDGTPCNSDAPCTGGGTCGVTQISKRYCETMVFSSVSYPGLSCLDDPCATGSCCRLDGCMDSERQGDCQLPDMFDPDIICGDLNPPCIIQGACCDVVNACTLQVSSNCVGANRYLGDGISCTPNPCNPPDIVSSIPPNGAIDARQPHDLSSAMPVQGINQVDMTFDNDVFMPHAGDFVTLQAGGDMMPPQHIVMSLSPTMVRLTFATAPSFMITPIDLFARTKIEHLDSGGTICIGYLPGDVDQDGSVGLAGSSTFLNDFNTLSFLIQANVTTDVYRVDIDRSGVTSSEDLVQFINLMNGAGAFSPIAPFTLPACP